MKSNPLRSILSLVALGALSSVAASDSAFAQDDREKKEERRVLKASDVQVSQSEEYRALARQKRHESMEFLKDILANRAPTGEQKAEMMLRLADLYFEEGRDLYLTEMQTFEKAYDQCFNTPGCNAENMKADNAESRKWQERSIKLYQQILQNYPQYQRADEATFYLASALQDIGERDESVKHFTNLVRTYPESKYVPDSYVQIGEYYFDNNNAYKALLAYERATRYKDSDKYAFAMYKLAWCYYNVGEYGKGIDTMKAVVAFSMTADQQAGGSNKMQLQQEALNDLVRFFADAGELDEAYEYFNKLGKKELISSMLKRLATTYFEQGKFEQCIQTYRRLIAEDPQSVSAPDYQNEIITAYQKIGRKDETMAEIDRLLKTYGKTSAWARANSANPDAVKQAEGYIEKSLRTVAINYHEEAKKYGTGKNARDTYALAEQAYSVYLQEFPTGENTYEMRYAYGELLYKLGKYEPAYEQYMAVVATDPNGKRSKFCANSAVYAAEKVVDAQEKANPTKPPAGSKEPMQLTDWESKYLGALDQYAKLYPDDKDTQGALYKAAYLLYEHNQFKESSERFRTVIAMNPGSDDAERAANLILDSLAFVEDWATLRDVAKAFYDQQGLGSKKFKDEVFTIYENSSFKLIEETYKKDNNKKAAADSYMQFVTAFPGSVSGDLALNNAAVYYYETQSYKQALEARHKLIETYPKSKYFNEQIARLGFAYESVADFNTAAKFYEQLFAIEPTHANAKDALYSAGLFRRAEGNWQQAVTNFDAYIKAYPDDARIADLKLNIAKIYQDNKQLDKAAEAYGAFFTTPPATATTDQMFFARFQYGKVLEAQSAPKARIDKHWQEMIAAYDAAKAKGAEMELAPAFIAQVKFEQTQPLLEKYMAMKISGPGRTANQKQTDEALGKQLVEKVKALQELEKKYIEIFNIGAGEWGLASLVQVGKLYDNMAETLTTSFIPGYLTEDQKEIYSMTLEDKAYVQTEKAVEAYSSALTEAYKYQVYDENTAYATRRLGELRPEDYNELIEELLPARYTTRSTLERTFTEKPE